MNVRVSAVAFSRDLAPCTFIVSMRIVAETLDPGPRDLGAFCHSRPDFALSGDEGVGRLDRFLSILG